MVRRTELLPAVLAAMMSVPACTTVENQPAPDAIAALDEASFRCTVEPILARDCSFLACHGIAGAPLRVYTVGKLRAGPDDGLDARQVPLTEDERRANFRSAVAFTFGIERADDSLLLRKALPPDAGGFGHRGGVIFAGPDDPRAVAIRAWLEGGTGCPAGVTP